MEIHAICSPNLILSHYQGRPGPVLDGRVFGGRRTGGSGASRRRPAKISTGVWCWVTMFERSSKVLTIQLVVIMSRRNPRIGYRWWSARDVCRGLTPRSQTQSHGVCTPNLKYFFNLFIFKRPFLYAQSAGSTSRSPHVAPSK